MKPDMITQDEAMILMKKYLDSGLKPEQAISKLLKIINYKKNKV